MSLAAGRIIRVQSIEDSAVRVKNIMRLIMEVMAVGVITQVANIEESAEAVHIINMGITAMAPIAIIQAHSTGKSVQVVPGIGMRITAISIAEGI